MEPETKLEKIEKIQKAAFLQMDSFDQLQMFNESFKEKLVYETSYYDQKTNTKKTKYELTFIGIKQLILEMSKKGEAMEILGEPKVERVKIDENPMNDVWQASITIRNIKTGHQSFGTAESAVYPWGNYPTLDTHGRKQWVNENGKNSLLSEWKQQYDPLGRNAAVSKATRNANRQQIPEMAIQLFVEAAIKRGDNAVEKINGTKDQASTEDPSIASNFCKDDKHKKDHDDKTNKCAKCGKMVRMPA